MSSGSASVGIVSQQNTDISALKRFTVAAEKRQPAGAKGGDEAVCGEGKDGNPGAG
ncbi:hypothetical protein LNQ03_32325 [Klebsiella pneumoniae subsp. pneumoniae]|nr:hypothetical protein [Klebsiella pneumoniae subsp. pneumoniae]